MAKHTVAVPIENKDYDSYLGLATQACEQLGWTVTYISETGLQAESPFSWKKNSGYYSTIQ